MDAIKILGSLLGNNATSSGIGDKVLGSVLGSMLGGGQSANTGGGLGSVLGSMLGGSRQPTSTGGGLGSVLGSILGSGQSASANTGGGLGGVLGSMLGGGGVQRGVLGGALGSVLGSMLGGGRSRSGINWGLVGGLAMAAFQMLGNRSNAAAGGASSLAGLEQMLDPEQSAAPVDEARIQQQALVLIKAMINAAKSDGQIDEQERQNILSKIAELGADEAEFLRQELAKPLNLDFVRDANPDMASNVYLMSLMAINLDTPEEANYMRQLAQQLGLDSQAVNTLHEQLELPPLYA